MILEAKAAESSDSQAESPSGTSPVSVAARNDALRGKIPFVLPPDMLVITRGVAHLGPEAVADILGKVKSFNVFREDNDPHKEHDFGVLVHSGQKLFWKIDDYGGHDGYRLVLTVMLAEEY